METPMVSPNDRLREVAYAYFEKNPRPALAPKMLAALDKEEGEFVRPALVRALAAVPKDPKVAEVLIRDADARRRLLPQHGDRGARRLQGRRRRARSSTEIAKIDGPLQDDAATALGEDRRQESARDAGGSCSDGAKGSAAGNCRGDLPDGHQLLGAHRLSGEDAHLRRHLSWLPGSAARRRRRPRQHRASGQRRGAAHPVRRRHSLAGSGARAGDARDRPGGAAQHAADAEELLEARPDQDGAIGIVAEAFDMLEEDLEEERFFVAVRTDLLGGRPTARPPESSANC